jgi:purine-binding chemotaxis protein CheW
MSRHKISTFRVDGDLFGVDAMLVQEVGRYVEVTAVPLAPPAVAGILNLRGEVVTALDLRRLLGRPDRAATDKPMNVVLRNEGGAVSLLVDEIESVEDVEDSTFEAIPETVTGSAREYLGGAYKMPDGLLLTLDVPRLLDPRPARSA